MALRWSAIVEVASHPPVSQIKPSLSTATQADAIRVSLLGKWAAHFAVPATKHPCDPAADLVGTLQGLDLTEFSIRHRESACMHDRFLFLCPSRIASHYDNAQKNRKMGHLRVCAGSAVGHLASISGRSAFDDAELTFLAYTSQDFDRLYKQKPP